MNTSFVERHNLTIRQGSAYLCRRSACHVKDKEYLDNHMMLLKCYYNFIWPHSALKFGRDYELRQCKLDWCQEDLHSERGQSHENIFKFAK